MSNPSDYREDLPFSEDPITPSTPNDIPPIGGDQNTNTAALAVLAGVSSSALDQRAEHVPTLAPFMQVFEDWLKLKKMDNMGDLLRDPDRTGLEGLIDFAETLEDLLTTEFDTFWLFFEQSYSKDNPVLRKYRSLVEDFLKTQFDTFCLFLEASAPQAVPALEKHRSLVENFFTHCGLIHLQSDLIRKIQDDSIHHPYTKEIVPGQKKWRAFVVEKDCEKALGSLRSTLAKVHATNLSYYSTGTLENDQAFIQHLSTYFGFDSSTAEALQAQVLDYYNLSNPPKAEHS